MKFNRFLYGAMALCMFASCSDNDFTANGGDGNNQLPGGDSYLGISLELPSEPSTRGVNDVFDDGTPTEYAVKNAALLLFKGAEEGDAVFIGAYKFIKPDEAFDQPNEDNITVSFQKAVKLNSKPKLTGTEKLWGLALVNYDTNICTIGTDADITIKNGADDITITSPNEENPTGTTFNTIRGYITNCDFRTNGFFMTNAPLSDKKGTTAEPTEVTIQTLANLDVDAIKETEIDAIQNPAGCIFVERAVAKVTCDFPLTAEMNRVQVEITEGGAPTYTDTKYKLNIESVEWAIDNEEQTSYIIRNATTTQQQTTPTIYNYWQFASEYQNPSKYRFIGARNMNDKVDETPYDKNEDLHKNLYRTYWCVDPFYNKTKAFNDQANAANAFTALTKGNTTFTPQSAFYPHENTFDVAHQNYKNTTRVVFKVKYGDPNDANFKLLALKEQSQTLYLKNDAENLFKRSVLGSTTLHELILKYMKEETTSLNYTKDDFDWEFSLATSDDAADKDLGDDIEKGDYILKTLTFKDAFITANFKENLTDAEKEDIATKLGEVLVAANNSNQIMSFNDNTCYYVVYLQHFGDDYCPLPAGWEGTTVGDVYYKDLLGNTTSAATSNKNYLGRYGLVRNNWYSVNVDAVNNLGSTTVPNGNAETSDDNKEEKWYLSARVHVLSWAKRTQNVSF